jgi:hypothetical protein
MITITLARKPVSATPITLNIQVWGTGGINIDASRIATTSRPLRITDMKPEVNGNTYVSNIGGSRAAGTTSLGRWPANVIFQHQERCQLAGQVSIRSRKDESPQQDEGRQDKTQWRIRPTPATSRGFGDASGSETITLWDCVDTCPIGVLNSQGGTTKSGVCSPTGRPIYPTAEQGKAMCWNANSVVDSTTRGFQDEGFISRFFKQIGNEHG